MKIVEAEEQLIEDLIGESNVVASRTTEGLEIYAGRHPTLGRVVIVRTESGRGACIEVDE